MPSVKLYPSIISTVLSWTTPDNAKADDGAYAVTAGTRNSNHDLIGSGFVHSIPAGSTINSVVAEVQYKLSTASSAWTGTLQAQIIGTLSGTATTITAEPTTDTVATANGGSIAYADLANLEVLFRVRRTSNTACNYSVDYLAVTVDYTEPSYNFSGSGAVTGAGSTTGTGNKQASGTGVTTGTAAMVGSGTKRATCIGTITGTGAITAEGVMADYTYDFSGLSSIEGQGLCIADGIKQARAPTAEIISTGSMTGSGTKQSTSIGTVSGVGNVLASGTKQAIGQGSISGTGAITAIGTADVPTYDYNGSGVVTGSGNIIGVGFKQATCAVQINGSGNITAIYISTRYGVGILIGTGIITATGTSLRLYRVDNPHRVQVTRPPSSKSVRTIETTRVTVQLKSIHRVVVTLDK